MDKEEQVKHIELVKEFIQKSPEEINEMFNTGMFNEIVLGAIIITMENLNHFNKNDIKNWYTNVRKELSTNILQVNVDKHTRKYNGSSR